MIVLGDAGADLGRDDAAERVDVPRVGGEVALDSCGHQVRVNLGRLPHRQRLYRKILVRISTPHNLERLKKVLQFVEYF